MIKTNIFNLKQVILLVAVTSLMLIATAFPVQKAEAATIAELQAQMVVLMEQISVLQAERETLPPIPLPPGPICDRFLHSLYPGATDVTTNGEVSKLQEYLTETGDYSYGKTTGYFGPSTQTAVQKWQSKNGVVSSGTSETTGYGLVGSLTRDALNKKCTPVPPRMPPEPSPTPIPLPSPIPVPGPIPFPTPTPIPVPSPTPIPLPSPIPVPGPIPLPSPTPEPTPKPLPTPLPPVPPAELATPKCDAFTTTASSRFGVEYVQFKWSTTNATNVWIDGGVGVVPVNGSKNIKVSNNGTYTLIASNGSKIDTCTAQGTVSQLGGSVRGASISVTDSNSDLDSIIAGVAELIEALQSILK